MSKFNVMVLRKKAREMGLDVAKTAKKVDVIRAIQVAEGNSPCFGKDGATCGQLACCWRSDCLEAGKAE
ncbi:MAG: hypothetical protein WC789_09700 [Lentisphaeria bacterium]|jgi:hypothetical protein